MRAMEDLSKWFAAHCDGLREHHHGISIVSTDNPGWWVKIDLMGTPLAIRSFARIQKGTSDDGHPNSARWIECSVENGIFSGAGDLKRLEEILEIFLAWANDSTL